MRGAAAIDARAASGRGLAFGALGVAIFALTLPMTRLAVGAADDPQLAPIFVTAGRAALAALASLGYLAWSAAPRPRRSLLPALAVSALGVVIGFPLFLALALRDVAATHGAVVTGVLPLATAAFGAIVLRQRASSGFWLCAGLGCALVLGYARLEGGGWQLADVWLLLAVASASIGYVQGARLAAELGAEAAICWSLVLCLPLTAPLALHTWPAHPVHATAWLAFGYLALFSMWLGFFAWYRGLALGGTLRVSQVQLLQPFLALLAASALLGEPLHPSTLGFALAVLATVFAGRRMRVARSTATLAPRHGDSP